MNLGRHGKPVWKTPCSIRLAELAAITAVFILSLFLAVG